MTLPIQITFRNTEHSDRIEAKIRQEAAKLDKFYSPIMSCRVVIETPEHRRRYGGLHHVRIDLGVPGGELVVKNEPSLHSSIPEGEDNTAKHLEVDSPHRQIDVAIRDAFRSARRQLQDYARRQRGDTKIHEPQQAQVVELFPEKGYGFLETTDGRQIYFHKNSILHATFGRMKVGSTVMFAEEQGEHGPQASTVRLVR
ncbi:MAG: HPF/RaiA family ribosome-associated protein [Acidobacteriia bacterium]|nr:HPF/RaiA family ribosome-associated protein [Terriglobia bacterium]